MEAGLGIGARLLFSGPNGDSQWAEALKPCNTIDIETAKVLTLQLGILSGLA
jgi:hypothetical protein